MVEMNEVSSSTEQQEIPVQCEEQGQCEEEGQCEEVGRLKYPERRRQAPVRYGFDEYASAAVTEGLLSDDHAIEPKILNEALASVHSREWKAAADSEYSLS